MAVLHPEPAVRLPEAVATPNLRLLLLDRERRGGTGISDVDRDLLGRLVDAPVVLGVRQPEEFRARLEAVSPVARAELYAFADIAMREVDDTRAVVLRAYAGPLTLALITLVEPRGNAEHVVRVPPPTLYWSLAPSSGDATARADVLDFLRVLHQEHTLRIVDATNQRVIGSFDGPATPFEADLDRDWGFMTDVAVLEEWSGMLLPVPREVDSHEVSRIHQAAEIVRAREVIVPVTQELTATLPGHLPEGGDDLILEQDFGVLVFGFDVPLGTGRARFPRSVVSMQPDPAHSGIHRVTLTAPGTNDQIVFALEPPPGRVASKRTLMSGEDPADAPDADWDEAWFERERGADRELRSGQGVRFSDENAFFAWLDQPDRDPAA